MTSHVHHSERGSVISDFLVLRPTNLVILLLQARYTELMSSLLSVRAPPAIVERMVFCDADVETSESAVNILMHDWRARIWEVMSPLTLIILFRDFASDVAIMHKSKVLDDKVRVNTQILNIILVYEYSPYLWIRHIKTALLHIVLVAAVGRWWCTVICSVLLKLKFRKYPAIHTNYIISHSTIVQYNHNIWHGT